MSSFSPHGLISLQTDSRGFDQSRAGQTETLRTKPVVKATNQCQGLNEDYRCAHAGNGCSVGAEALGIKRPSNCNASQLLPFLV